MEENEEWGGDTSVSVIRYFLGSMQYLTPQSLAMFQLEQI